MTPFPNYEPQPIFNSVKAFAPGFNFLGCSVDGIGDIVSISVDPNVHPGHMSISHISGDNGNKLSKNPIFNCAGIAAIEFMKMLWIRSVGLSLQLHKGLPLGSGLGSSAASAAAVVVAVNGMFGNRLGVQELVLASLKSEEKVSGYHADNVAPAIMGGFVLIQSYEPLNLMKLKFSEEKDLFFVQADALVVSVLLGEVLCLGKALSSDKIDPKRAPLIPGMEAVKRAALQAGAFGCTISGADPTTVAVIDDEAKGNFIGKHMVEAFLKDGNLKASTKVRQFDWLGGRLISSTKN
ncbi:hypothetical protein TanjilG_17542 [Lupinus angustifolius]|uniref:Homoserine kinase n=1 Tax=Lupinus angustifolius TaxID=3871 RepID=A0A1J7I3G7_LUPAN|nr:hypothetical protein TanjilG_17542 [Lupinus angustifolius]